MTEKKFMSLAYDLAKGGQYTTKPGVNVGCVIVKKGKIIDLEGKEIGQHEGIINYTVGQRKGIKIASNSNW